MDAITSYALQKILGLKSHELTDEHILQAQLPIRKGGLGLTSAADTAIPAYAGSRMTAGRRENLVGNILFNNSFVFDSD